jgi:hypothetical protein
MKPYILLLNSGTVSLKASTLNEVKRILGDQTSPLMACSNGAAIGFSTASTPTEMVGKIKLAVGDRMQVLILELGSDHAQWGSPIHHQFLDGLRRMTNGAKRNP